MWVFLYRFLFLDLLVAGRCFFFHFSLSWKTQDRSDEYVIVCVSVCCWFFSFNFQLDSFFPFVFVYLFSFRMFVYVCVIEDKAIFFPLFRLGWCLWAIYVPSTVVLMCIFPVFLSHLSCVHDFFMLFFFKSIYWII